MTETRSINISSKAYYKIMLHCMKHTSSDCYGFLIGNVKDNTYHINEAVPFTHDKIFAPSLEIAVKMISIYMATEGTIVGIYENQMFNQMKDDGTISAQGLTLCELINTKTRKLRLTTKKKQTRLKNFCLILKQNLLLIRFQKGKQQEMNRKGELTDEKEF